MIIMMEENNDIFLVSDTVLYLSEPIHKIYSTKLFRGHPFSSQVYLMTDFSNFFFSLVRTCTHF